MRNHDGRGFFSGQRREQRLGQCELLRMHSCIPADAAPTGAVCNHMYSRESRRRGSARGGGGSGTVQLPWAAASSSDKGNCRKNGKWRYSASSSSSSSAGGAAAELTSLRANSS